MAMNFTKRIKRQWKRYTWTNPKPTRKRCLEGFTLFQLTVESLNENYENVMCAIEESKDLEDLTVNDLAGLLKVYEQRKKKKTSHWRKHYKPKHPSKMKMYFTHKTLIAVDRE
ncbi:uncharacterized protein LOC111458671 [Cucurbita moschata]|uniref:Uncharacterized protein LOC111458671 n=1 Tax=Cucurbita moschata TaxID=3662 RepID=A0A6J1GZL2_CUCMO|nr:uncharacterized protein LOC111458671 [Cucurbita moschata]